MGHQVPLLITHTFQDTGRTVQIRKLSPFLKDDVSVGLRKRDRRDGKVPIAPMVPGVEGKLEPNEADPDFLEARLKYEYELISRVNIELMRVAIHRGIELEITDDIHAEVDELISQLQSYDLELDETDPKVLYITRICVGSDNDTSELYDALFRRSIPTREAVEAHKATFPDTVEGSAD